MRTITTDSSICMGGEWYIGGIQEVDKVADKGVPAGTILRWENNESYINGSMNNFLSGAYSSVTDFKYDSTRNPWIMFDTLLSGVLLEVVEPTEEEQRLVDQGAVQSVRGFYGGFNGIGSRHRVKVKRTDRCRSMQKLSTLPQFKYRDDEANMLGIVKAVEEYQESDKLEEDEVVVANGHLSLHGHLYRHEVSYELPKDDTEYENLLENCIQNVLDKITGIISLSNGKIDRVFINKYNANRHYRLTNIEKVERWIKINE